VGDAYLAIMAVVALLVVNAYVPVRRDPLSGPSFFAGWLTGELAFQNIVVVAAVTVVFAVVGVLRAGAGWPGWAGLVLAALSAAGLAGLGRSGLRAHQVVAAALHDATGPPLELPEQLPAPTWGRWWRVTRAVPLAGRALETVRDLDYDGDGDRRHRLDVVRARGLAPGAPVMVYIHGGGWTIGDKSQQGKPMLYELAARGWVCVSINYRLSPKHVWPAHVVDCKKALAWVHEHIAEYGGDPGFVAVSGGSAGGHLAALVALTAGDDTWQPGFEGADTSVQAAVPLYGVYDMTADPASTGRYGSGLKILLEREVMKQPIAEHRHLFEQASPTYRVHADAPPFFVLHGGNDTLVPVDSARLFVDALRQVSAAPVAYAELPLAQHAFDVLASFRCQGTTAGAVAFLDAVRAAAGIGEPDTTPEQVADPAGSDVAPA